MAITLDILKAALGDKFDPGADYLVCAANDQRVPGARRYRQIGTFTYDGTEMVAFDRNPPLANAPAAAEAKPERAASRARS